MHRRSLILAGLLLLVAAMPLAASQFVKMPFDQVARESALVVRGTIGDTWSAWDDAHEVIYTYANVRVTRYFGERTGPDTIVIREVGGVVDGYVQEAIGFPAIRSGEEVVLMLARLDDGAEYRIHAYNQGKFLVRQRGDTEVLIEDPLKQGEGKPERGGRFDVRTNAADDVADALTIDEFATMVDAARAGERVERLERPRQ